ncbi:MAG: Crp/Fnr family transcriptional regulator [Sideroxyarcus sp.]|nr:Crp/Fnr family transcriptional regulator [Sideroxyarcus sp.]
MKRSEPGLHPVLAELLPAELHALCTQVQAGKGERLFATGKKPAFMFFVICGEVTLERLGRNGESVILQRSRHGFVGEASLNSPRYHCDARAVADSTLARIPIRELRASLERDPVFAMRWICMLNREVKRLRMQCERFSLNGVQHRLIHLIETEGTQGRYPLGAGLKSVAKELGVTHEALYRCVAALEKNGDLLRDGGELHLLREPAA